MQNRKHIFKHVNDQNHIFVIEKLHIVNHEKREIPILISIIPSYFG